MNLSNTISQFNALLWAAFSVSLTAKFFSAGKYKEIVLHTVLHNCYNMKSNDCFPRQLAQNVELLPLICFQIGGEVTKGGKGDKRSGKKSPTKGAKGAAGGVAQKKEKEESVKTESKLKKRGEAEAEVVFISKI